MGDKEQSIAKKFFKELQRNKNVMSFLDVGRAASQGAISARAVSNNPAAIAAGAVVGVCTEATGKAFDSAVDLTNSLKKATKP